MDTKKFLKLSDIESFRISFHLSNYVWDVVSKWSSFSQRTVGEQFVRAVDSISANIAEGFGRYGKKDKIKAFIDFGSFCSSPKINLYSSAVSNFLIFDFSFQFNDSLNDP